jgi:Putative Flp pilus-assembly TadE/G-like
VCRPHSGQASVLLVALMASMVACFAVAFSAGQLVNDKMRLVNAADAAAYSAAVWEARSLNFQSYMNRAIVANEVALAQLVSLRSWSRYMTTATSNGARVAQFIPPLAAPIRALAQGWRAIDTTLQSTLPGIEAGLSTWNVAVLANAESVSHQQAAIVAADLVSEVARRNEPRAQVTNATRLLEARNAAEWQNRFTDRYRRGGGDLRRFSTLLMDSRDGFSRSRRGSLPLASPLIDIARRGGTDLIAENTWRGVDTLSAHIDLLLASVEIPIGWGAAEQQRVSVNQRGTHGGSLSRNPVASRLALRALRPLRSYRGIPEIRDIITPTRRDDRTLRYAVALSMPASSLSTADRLLMPEGIHSPDGARESLAPDLAGQAIHALGAAEIFFQRPLERADGRREYPSLFNPYWHARLVDVTGQERMLTAPMRGVAVDPFAVAP